jgi:four helix bundle protein
MKYGDSMIEDFTNFDAWRKAMDIAEHVHAFCKRLPKDERYSLVPQMRRAAVSVVANIAEGFGRYSPADKKHKYVQARGELTELMTFLLYCHRVQYCALHDAEPILNECRNLQQMLNALVRTMHGRVET